ncbi:deoxycytidylate deaminase [Streptomyces sp. NEAU-Y11]|uniref:deoxycytidylate deaminase n=1 Tax=Streptomyces cucumeris TaxID=2962890 RepID=UPI0020C92DE9|nr:deaminase [Streptomyces sp. NEAU-Y11]MCP9209637.1 deaminase [Streptomyces sp. NEAU-Y11]
MTEESRHKRRPDWDTWAIGIAEAVSKRGDCTRRQVGAVLLDENHRVIGCGYNGGPSGGASCLEGACPRGLHHLSGDSCACGGVWPCMQAAPPGSSYDTSPGGQCIAIHAEVNALLDVSDRRRLEGSTLYITTDPCLGCQKIIGNTGVARVVWPGGEWRKP